jgi:hypothetical protein
MAVLALLLGLASNAQAIEFDDKLRGPAAANVAELKATLEEHTAAVAAGDLHGLSRVRSASATRREFDARWKLGRMVDARRPMPELESLGFVAKGDGSYSIDIQAHPEWRSLTDSLWQIVKSQSVSHLAPALESRGFRPQDTQAMRQYVETHDLERLRGQRKLELGLSASRYARKLQRLKRPVDDAFVWSYVYQRALGIAELERQWAEGLLDALEPQAQRILASYLSESQGSWFIVPTSNDASIQYERELLLKPDFEQLARKAFEEGRL